jgi:hypothetical protein
MLGGLAAWEEVGSVVEFVEYRNNFTVDWCLPDGNNHMCIGI